MSVQLVFKDYSLTIRKELLISFPYFKNYFERWDEDKDKIIDFSNNENINQANFLYILFNQLVPDNDKRPNVFNDYNYFGININNINNEVILIDKSSLMNIINDTQCDHLKNLVNKTNAFPEEYALQFAMMYKCNYIDTNKYKTTSNSISLTTLVKSNFPSVVKLIMDALMINYETNKNELIDLMRIS